MSSETSKFKKKENFDSAQKSDSEKISDIIIYDRATINKIFPSKRKLEEKLNVKININKEQVEIEGDEADIYTAKRVLDAIERTFSVDIALLLIDPDYILEDIHIKAISKKKDLEVVRARVIGTEGRTIQILGELSEGHLVLHNNIVSIIGNFEKIKDITNAVKGLISGSKQANIYKYLEKARKRYRPENISLKKNQKE